MPNSLPFPLRVFAGLLATGVDAIRRLPADLPGMGVEVAGAVTKATLQVRQQLTELAIRGDELLDAGREPEEHPAWARFDDEDTADIAEPTADDGPPAEPVDALPLAGYDAMTAAQVRGHLRTLTIHDLRQLLEHEQSSLNRPALLTMLSNRITTLEQQ